MRYGFAGVFYFLSAEANRALMELVRSLSTGCLYVLKVGILVRAFFLTSVILADAVSAEGVTGSLSGTGSARGTNLILGTACILKVPYVSTGALYDIAVLELLIASRTVALGITVVNTGGKNDVSLYVVSKRALTSGNIGKAAVTAYLFGITVLGTGRILYRGAVVVSKRGSVLFLGLATA